VPKSYAVYSFDLPGHGKSDGKRGYVERFSNYVDDVKTYYDMVKQAEQKTLKYSGRAQYGRHYCYRLCNQTPDELNGLLLSGALLKAGASVTKAAMFMATVLSALMPKMGVTKLDASAVNRDKGEVDAYITIR